VYSTSGWIQLRICDLNISVNLLIGELAAVAKVDQFKGRNIANTLWAMAKMGHNPGQEFFQAMVKQSIKRIKDFNAQNLANTLWAFASIGEGPLSIRRACQVMTVQDV
jgi:hypothetical protein